LKIDIDSIDLPVVCAILAGGFRPTLIMAEYNQWTPPPIEFAALELRRGEEFTGLVPSYQANFRGFNREWPCAGTSLASWARFASEFGYSLLQLDRPPLNSNILMLRSDLHAKHFSEWSTGLDCHLGAFKHWGMVRLIPFDMFARMSRAEKGLWSSKLPGHPHPRGTNSHQGKLQVNHVPYKGGAPGLTDLMARNVDMMIIQPTSPEQVSGGRVRALAVTSPRRNASWPDLPSVSEAGLPGYESQAWYGMVGPRGLPREVLSKLSEQAIAALTTKEMRQRIAAQGGEVVASSPAEFGTFIRSEIERYAKVVRESGIVAE
jgi:hypothetical protein